jgi:hypothetical protein
VRSGHLHAIHRGVYAIGHQRLSQRGHWLAAVLAHGSGALLSHGSAAALWGLQRPRSPIDVTSSSGHPGRLGIRLHRGRIHAEDRAIRDATPVTSLARTLFDLAELVDEQRLERVFEEADRLNLLRLRELERVCEHSPGRHALRPIRRLIAEVRHPETTRSPLEDRFVSFCRRHDLPTPVLNTSVLNFEIDALWPAQRLVVELDGFAFHHHHAAFQRDRARDAALQAAGYHTIRLTHYRLDHESPIVLTEIRQLLSLGGSPR